MDKEHAYERTPVVPKELVEWLDSKFPIQNPDLDEGERLIFYRVGQRSVVDHLLALLGEQSENILEQK